MQNHLLQIMCLVAMERPTTTDPEDIRYEKVKVLRCTKTLQLQDLVLGQYVANHIPGNTESDFGYQDDETVPKVSNQEILNFLIFLRARKLPPLLMVCSI